MSTTDTPQANTTPIVQLYADIGEDGTGAPTLPIRWCVSPALIAELRERGFTRPHLAIAVRAKSVSRPSTNHSWAEWRQTWMYVVPLTRELQYVSFSRPGENEVRVVVVDLPDSDAAKAIHEGPLFYEDGCFESWRTTTEVAHLQSSITALTVQVPADMFAPEPRPWVKRFVGNFFDGNPFDQCHFRRRKIVSFGVFAPLLLIVGLPVRILLAAISLFVGRRFNRTDWEGLLPFNMSEIPWGSGKSVYHTDKHGNANGARFPLWFLNPITLGILPLLTFVFMNYVAVEHHGHSANVHPVLSIDIVHAYEYVDGALAVLVAIIGIVIGLVYIFDAGFRKTFKSETTILRRRARRRNRVEQHKEHQRQQAKALYKRLEGMTCSQADPDVSVRALPWHRQTIYLHYSALKASVCKPFAR